MGSRYFEAIVDGAGELGLARWVEQDLGHGWWARITFDVVQASEARDALREELRIAGVSIESRGEPTVPLAQIHKRLALGPALKLAEVAAATPFGLGRSKDGEANDTVNGPRPLLARAGEGHPGRGGHGLAHYADLARGYVEGSGRGESVADIAENAGLSPAALRRGLRKAERLGLVTKAVPGKIGRELTADGHAALRVLDERPAPGATFIEEPDPSNPFFRAADNGWWLAKERAGLVG